ncbi:MAG: S4 domain-containing protein, partial [Giesbergeria sp.]
MRIDQLLVERGVAASRAQAQRLLAGGAQWRVGQGDWRRIAKNGDDVPLEAEVQLHD